jgi:polyribonucleotide nucleotidyltransferase
MVNAIANPTVPEVGERFVGTVVKTAQFGAFVSLTPGKDGLLHISQIKRLVGGKRVDNVEDVIKVGDKVQVEIGEIDDRGKVSLFAVVEGEENGTNTDSNEATSMDSVEDATPKREPAPLPKTGDFYTGTVANTTSFGAFVSLTPEKDGLLHISQIRKLVGGKRIEAVTDVHKVGDEIEVQVGEIDGRGKIALLAVLPEVAEAPAEVDTVTHGDGDFAYDTAHVDVESAPADEEA